MKLSTMDTVRLAERLTNRTDLLLNQGGQMSEKNNEKKNEKKEKIKNKIK